MGIMKSVKGFMGMDEEDYEDYEEYEEYDDEEEEQKKPTFASFGRKNKVVNISTNRNQSKIIIVKPKTFDDSTLISDEIVANKPVIFDVAAVDSEDARRIVDFVAGTVYGLGGNIKRVSGGIFVAAPAHIDIESDVFQEQTKTSFNWDHY